MSGAFLHYFSPVETVYKPNQALIALLPLVVARRYRALLRLTTLSTIMAGGQLRTLVAHNGVLMKQVEINLQTEYIALCTLLKLAGVAGSAGQGKHMVAAGEVMVNDQPESRKTAKIRAGQWVDCLGTRILVRGLR